MDGYKEAELESQFYENQLYHDSICGEDHPATSTDRKNRTS